VMVNRLADSTSPYLLQHKDNPVDWWQWGPDALAEAEHLSKPILLSIGYAACHWCHVPFHRRRNRISRTAKCIRAGQRVRRRTALCRMFLRCGESSTLGDRSCLLALNAETNRVTWELGLTIAAAKANARVSARPM